MPNQNETKPTLKIIPLGGLHEIGKNTCVLEYNDEIIIVDGGIAFPTDEMHGINIVLPDMTYLRENRDKIKAMIVTHGHEDHIGGISYHLKQFDIPVIYGPRLALALLGDKLEEAGVAERTILETVSPREIVKVSPSFSVEFIRNTHSIADSFTIAIHTPLGVIIHTGDFKVDHTPVDGEHFDLQKLAEHGEKGVLCLLSDSTNAEVPGHTASESSVYPNLDRVFAQTTGRLMLTTFASSVHRVKIVLDLAQKHNRKVVVVGRSMLNVIAHARNLGYIKCPDNLFEPLKALRYLPDEKVLILTTGSQGEPLAALTRIARGEHRHIKVRQGDTVVFSANPIPGNTIAVVNTIDTLMMQGANVVYGRDQGIHVSGHGAQEDHKLMLALTKPKFFVPVHGEHRMLVKHARTAQNMGIPAENMVIINNGDIVELTADSIKKAGKVPSGIELVDQAGIVHETVMKERQQLAEEGVLTVAAAIDRNGTLISQPEIHLRGVVTTVERSLLKQLIIRDIEKFLSERWSAFSRTNEDDSVTVDVTRLRLELESSLDRLVKRELRTEPLIVVLVQTSEPFETITSDNDDDGDSDTNNNGNNHNNHVINKPTLSTKFPRRRKRSTASVAS
jgi:ribonuclease J